MSRVRTGLRPGDWLEEEPRSAHITSHGGSLVVGQGGAEERHRLAVKDEKRRRAVARAIERAA